MMHSFNMLIYSMIPMIISMFMLYNNIFISMEMSIINMLSFNMPITIMLDWISCMFMSIVMFISSMIIMFSMFYIPLKEQKQFYILLLMFILSMNILIISDNIIFILLGWDGLGLSSYILVIYYQNFSSAASGSITLLSNRIGDIMILISISIMMINSNWNFNMNNEFNMLALLLLTTAACSKSAQFPFSAWLPAAMAAPTPISALVHSSTLVTAGVFLLIRIMNNIHPLTMLILMITSSATSLYAGMAANWEQDMKKIIALSTLSQIAMMMFAISLKSTTMAFFHLISHAMFKSTMFICAGIMIHNSSYQDMRMMGMTMSNSPITLSILGVSSMALMGLPFMSGFFSKDSIMEMMLTSNTHYFLSLMMIMSIGLTASYSIRMSILSNNSYFKSKSDMNYNNNIMSLLPICLMSPMSIILGAILFWILNPEQMFIFPTYLKISIMVFLLLGLMLGMMLSFKSKIFKKMGESSISLWFIHMMTTNSMNLTSKYMNLMFYNDKMWQEMYGPQGLYMMLKNSSMYPNMIKMLTLFIMIMMLILPLIFN